MLSPVLLLWLVAGVGNGAGTVFYESLLQERVPDSLRGRVIAASEAVLDASFLGGAFLAGLVGSHLGIRTAFVVSGVLFLLAALITRLTIARPSVPLGTPDGSARSGHERELDSVGLR